MTVEEAWRIVEVWPIGTVIRLNGNGDHYIRLPWQRKREEKSIREPIVRTIREAHEVIEAHLLTVKDADERDELRARAQGVPPRLRQKALSRPKGLRGRPRRTTP